MLRISPTLALSAASAVMMKPVCALRSARARDKYRQQITLVGQQDPAKNSGIVVVRAATFV